MADWVVEDGEVAVDGAVDAVDIRIPTGSVTVAVTDGPARVVVSDVVGGPVFLHDAGGVLTIRQPAPEGGAAIDDIVNSLLSAVRVGPGVKRQATVTVLLPRPARVTARTVGAAVMFSGLEEASVDTVAGDVTVSRMVGALRVGTVSGALRAADVDGRLTVTTVSGDVTIARGHLSELRAKTVSGDVAVDAELGEGNHTFRAVSGNLALRAQVPDGLDFEAASVSGMLMCSLGDVVDASRPGMRRLRSVTGAGGARFRSQTVTGDVTILGPLVGAV